MIYSAVSSVTERDGRTPDDGSHRAMHGVTVKWTVNCEIWEPTELLEHVFTT